MAAFCRRARSESYGYGTMEGYRGSVRPHVQRLTRTVYYDRRECGVADAQILYSYGRSVVAVLIVSAFLLSRVIAQLLQSHPSTLFLSATMMMLSE